MKVNKSKLEDVVKDLYNQLKSSYDCFVKIDEFNCINIKFDKVKQRRDDEEHKFQMIANGDTCSLSPELRKSHQPPTDIKFHFSNVYKCTPHLLTFIKSPEKQKECYEYITLGKDEFGLKNVFEADLDIIIDPTDRSPSLIEKDEAFFDPQEDGEGENLEFTRGIGKELVQLYTLICDSQHSVEKFILTFTSELVNQENINLFVDYGIQNGYIEKSKQFNLHK